MSLFGIKFLYVEFLYAGSKRYCHISDSSLLFLLFSPPYPVCRVNVLPHSPVNFTSILLHYL